MVHWALGTSKDLWRGTGPFQQGFYCKYHPCSYTAPGKQNYFFCTYSRVRKSHPLVKVSDALQTRTRGNRMQCPEQRPVSSPGAVCSPAPGPELFSGALGLQPTGSSQGYMSKLHSSFASAFSRCRCQLEPWTPWRKTKPRAFATSFTTALQVGLMGQ